nr:MAG TPA: tail fiber protein [Caudoviricetes sp.]
MKQPSQLTTVFAADGLKRTLPENGEPNDVLASFSLGFPPRTMATDSTAVPPAGQDINGILNVLSSIIQYLQAGGGYVFSSSFAEAIGGYPIGARVDSSDGKTQWINTLANNKNNPEVSGVGWISDAPAVMEGATANTAGKQGFVPAPSAGDQNKVLTGSGEWKHASGVPVGTVVMFTAAEPPAGYLKCDGAAVGRETCPELFAAIGTTYGAGDGSTTFNLPNLIGRFAEGSATPGTVKEAGLPNLVGNSDTVGFSDTRFEPTGCFYPAEEWTVGTFNIVEKTGTAGANVVRFDASHGNPTYGKSDTVQPPALTLLPCIKAFDASVNPGLIDITELANEVAGKADISLSNLSATGKSVVASLAMPSSRYIDLTLGASGMAYTAPADGWVFLWRICSGGGSLAGLYGRIVSIFSGDANEEFCIYIPVAKGEVFKVFYTGLKTGQSTDYFRFFYANGSQS